MVYGRRTIRNTWCAPLKWKLDTGAINKFITDVYYIAFFQNNDHAVLEFTRKQFQTSVGNSVYVNS